MLNKKWSIKKSSKLVNLIEKKQNVSKYQLSQKQVDSILELKLQKLTAYGINEIGDEIKNLSEQIIYFNRILKSKKELFKLIIAELENIKSKFAIKRRTKIIDAVLNYSIEETIQKEAVVINITNKGYIKRGSLSSVKSQKRGGKGKTGITTREEDFVIRILSGSSHSQVLFFSSQGIAYKLKAWKIPKGTLSSKGKSLFNLLPLKNTQSITSTLILPENENEWKKMFVIFITENGKVRKNSLEDFTNINTSGKIAMKLDQNDKIIGVEKCREDQDIILATKFGKCIRFMSKKLRLFKGRSSKGIRGIDLAKDDKVISLSIIDSKNENTSTKKNGSKSELNNKYILSITENGYGKRTLISDFRTTNRGGKGIIGIINSERNGNVTSTLAVSNDEDVILSTDKGRVIRCSVKEIRIAGRNTQGVRIIKLSGGEKVVSAIKVEDNIE